MGAPQEAILKHPPHYPRARVRQPYPDGALGLVGLVMTLTARASRGAIGRMSTGVIVALVLVGAAALAATVLQTPRAPPPSSQVQAVARAVTPAGGLTTFANYSLGQELLLSVTVPNSTAPVSLHQVFHGRTYGELAWNVTATHYTYVIDSGPADPADVGVNQVYAIVTFSDGQTARSNNVTMAVTG